MYIPSIFGDIKESNVNGSPDIGKKNQSKIHKLLLLRFATVAAAAAVYIPVLVTVAAAAATAVYIPLSTAGRQRLLLLLLLWILDSVICSISIFSISSIFPFLFTIQLTVPYCPYLFTIQLTFFLYFRNLFTIQPTFLRHFSYLFII